jgi:hypothetical protein
MLAGLRRILAGNRIDDLQNSGACSPARGCRFRPERPAFESARLGRLDLRGDPESRTKEDSTWISPHTARLSAVPGVAVEQGHGTNPVAVTVATDRAAAKEQFQLPAREKRGHQLVEHEQRDARLVTQRADATAAGVEMRIEARLWQ